MYKYGLFTLLISLCLLSTDLEAQRRRSKKKKKGQETEQAPSSNDPELALEKYLDGIKELDSTGKAIEEKITDTVIIEDIDFIDQQKPVEEPEPKKGKKHKKRKTKLVNYYSEYEEEINSPLEPLFETSFTSILKKQKTDELIFYYGFMSTYSQPVNRTYQGQSFGIFSLSYRKNISDGAALGFDIGYENINPIYLKKGQITTDEFRNLTINNSTTLSYDQFFIMLYGKWIYKKLEFMELYSGAHIGFMSIAHNLSQEEDHLFSFLAYQIDLGGLGFAITPNLKLYIEAGFGNMGKIKMGLAYMY